MFYLHSRAEALAAAVTPTDVHLAVWASRIFHTLHILPIALYYAIPFEDPLLFPCSLSFTQRKGLPMIAYHIIKSLAWLLLGSVLVRRGGAYGAFWLAAVNVPGLCGSFFYTVESDIEKHKVAQLVELLVATQLMPYIKMPRRYKAGVYVFLVLLIIFTVIIETIEKEFNLPTEGELASSPTVIAAWRRCVVDKACGHDASKMTLIWWSKLAWLASEWLMFASLFQGIGKGWDRVAYEGVEENPYALWKHRPRSGMKSVLKLTRRSERLRAKAA